MATSFARSGDQVGHLISKLSQDVVQKALAKADYVTVCIGANDVLTPCLENLETYFAEGKPALSEIESLVVANLNRLATDSEANSYNALFKKLTSINPYAKFVFTTIYNPYKYLWIEKGTWDAEYTDSFFAPVFKYIPEMTTLGVEWDRVLKKSLLNTNTISMLFDRVNGLDAWTETYVSQLNSILRRKIEEYANPNFILADTKAVFDPVPNRTVSAPKYYNDLVNVEYTKGYNMADMDWGQLWNGNVIVNKNGNPVTCNDAETFWDVLFGLYIDGTDVDYEGLAGALVLETVDHVVIHDVDPHPEAYGHHALHQSFSDALGWSTLPRRTITFNANGGAGTMTTQTVVALDSYTAYTNINALGFTPGAEGYYFTGWNTKADGSGISYSNGQFIGLSGDLTLYAQWSNIYAIRYRHTNQTTIYTNDETGHMECYALYINGELMPKLGKFSDGNSPTYYVPYGTIVRVVVSNYSPTELTYDDVDCDVYWNGTSVASGYRGTEYTFSLERNVEIEFQWKIAGSLATFDAQSWEDCYITTY